MGEARTQLPPAKLIFGLLFTDEPLRLQCLERLQTEFGRIDHQSAVEPFACTAYYDEEMGAPIYRQYVSSEALIDMGDLPRIKLRTNDLEGEWSVANTERKRRRVNIDPGYVTPAKLVLATTKDYSHRIYLAQGIFAEVTLHYQRPDGFQPYPWTYPDYARPEVCRFFNTVRDTWFKQVRK